MKYTSAIAALSLIGCGLGGNAPDISSLQGRIGALEAEVEWLRRIPGAPGAMGERGPAGPQALSPHLVVVETGEDLGFSIGNDCSWNDRAGGEICVSQTHAFDFSMPDCEGAMFINGFYRWSRRFNFRDKTWYKPAGAKRQMTVVSSLVSGRCYNDPPRDETATPLEDTGVAAAYHAPDELAMELR